MLSEAYISGVGSWVPETAQSATNFGSTEFSSFPKYLILRDFFLFLFVSWENKIIGSSKREFDFSFT